jgi:hypothetical protein
MIQCNYDITWGDIAFTESCCNWHESYVCERFQVIMWLSHDTSSEYALEIAKLGVF